MICQNIKELAQQTDECIQKFISLNIPITDTEGQHSLMVFMLERVGYKLYAKSCTTLIKNCFVHLDDAFSLDEHLQDLHSLCCESIMNSKRYGVA